MKNFSIRSTTGCYQYMNGTNTVFTGAEARCNGNFWNASVVGSVASDDFNNIYGLIDLKGKLNYDPKGVVEQNIRVRTSFDNDLNSTQIRYSPLTINVPIADGVSIYSNTHYSGKYDYNAAKWKHSMGNFTGVSYNCTKNDNLSLEVQRYNLQNITDNSPANWGINFMYTHSF